mmetsp:Transcript_12362/g.36992  ORF Transcript_12362/g.36992 Transcript_12362/m.36992 type:complete len:240 (+) Transcript_12362:1367-2086(+)
MGRRSPQTAPSSESRAMWPARCGAVPWPRRCPARRGVSQRPCRRRRRAGPAPCPGRGGTRAARAHGASPVLPGACQPLNQPPPRHRRPAPRRSPWWTRRRACLGMQRLSRARKWQSRRARGTHTGTPTGTTGWPVTWSVPERDVGVPSPPAVGTPLLPPLPGAGARRPPPVCQIRGSWRGWPWRTCASRGAWIRCATGGARPRERPRHHRIHVPAVAKALGPRPRRWRQVQRRGRTQRE